METDNNQSVMEAVDEEIENIIRHRYMTAYEQRTETLKNEIRAVEDQFRLAGALSSGAFVKKTLELLCKAARDIVFTVFSIPPKKYVLNMG
jgi:hypothetical protein